MEKMKERDLTDNYVNNYRFSCVPQDYQGGNKDLQIRIRKMNAVLLLLGGHGISQEKQHFEFVQQTSKLQLFVIDVSEEYVCKMTRYYNKRKTE